MQLRPRIIQPLRLIQLLRLQRHIIQVDQQTMQRRLHILPIIILADQRIMLPLRPTLRIIIPADLLTMLLQHLIRLIGILVDQLIMRLQRHITLLLHSILRQRILRHLIQVEVPTMLQLQRTRPIGTQVKTPVSLL